MMVPTQNTISADVLNVVTVFWGQMHDSGKLFGVRGSEKIMHLRHEGVWQPFVESAAKCVKTSEGIPIDEESLSQFVKGYSTILGSGVLPTFGPFGGGIGAHTQPSGGGLDPNVADANRKVHDLELKYPKIRGFYFSAGWPWLNYMGYAGTHGVDRPNINLQDSA